MFRSIFTKSLRGYRWAILGWGIGLGVVIYAQFATYASTFTATSAAQLQQLAGQFRFFGEAVRLDTPGGFVTFKVMGLLPVILGIWTLLAGARMTRGEEESGALDILLATPRSRVAVIGQKLLALGAATTLICLLIGLWSLAGMASAHAPVDPAGAFLAALNLGVAAYVFGALALLLAQFVSRGAAAAWAGGLMALAYVLDGTGRADPNAAGLRTISPLYYYDQSLSLIPGHAVSWGALALLVALCALLAGAALLLFARRDIGRSALADVAFARGGTAARERPARQVLARAAREVWLRDVGLLAWRRQSTATAWWIAALAIVSGYLVIVAKTSERQFQQLLGGSPFVQKLFNGTSVGTNNGFLSVLVFGYMPLLLAIFCGVLAYRWATDLDSGRLELTLGTPQPRWRIALERFGAVLVAGVSATAGIWLAIVLFAQGASFSLDLGRVTVAAIGMLPLALITAALVFALAGLLPPGAVLGIMAVFLGVSYLADLLRSLLGLPGWVVSLSIFHQYGTPMVTGLSWGAFVVMLLIAAALVGVGAWQFTARDLDRGTAGS